MAKRRLTFAVVLLAVALTPHLSRASDHQARMSDTFTFYMENDFFENLDRYYTHGTKFSWISRDLSNFREVTSIPQWMQGIIGKAPLVNDPEQQRSVSLSFGQNIYTPEHKEKKRLIKDDRPYAGVTYLGLGLHSRNTKHMDTLELDIGIVGRHSYAEDIQTKIHEWMDSEIAKGWKNQLHDEPIVNLYFERKWRLSQTKSSTGWGFDLIPHTGLAIGNAYTGVNAGGQVRLGWNMPNDFGTYLIRPGSDSSAPLDDTDPRFFAPLHRFGVHAFFAVDGKAVARNILLDGNTFRDSHSVDREPFVADLIGGVGLIIYRVKITYSYVHKTKEFKTQKDEQNFGAIAASFTF